MPRTVNINIEQFKRQAVQFPHRCVYCGASAVSTVPVHITHEQYEGSLEIPYCRKHLNELNHGRRLLLRVGVGAMVVGVLAIVGLVASVLSPHSALYVERGGGLILLAALLLGPFAAFGLGVVAAVITRQTYCQTQPMLTHMPIVRTLCCVLGSTMCCERPGVDIEPKPFAVTQRVESLTFTFDDEQFATDFATLNHAIAR